MAVLKVDIAERRTPNREAIRVMYAENHSGHKPIGIEGWRQSGRVSRYCSVM
jgi:hypothetical protein